MIRQQRTSKTCIDNKWNNIIFQTLFKHDQSADTSVAILKRMNSFKLHMKIQNTVRYSERRKNR